MANIPLPGQSTDKLITDTSPLTPRVLKTGSITVSGFAAVTGGYAASGSVQLSVGDLDDALVPIVDVTHYVVDGGGVWEHRKAPYTITAGTAITRNAYVTVYNQLVSGSTYEIRLYVNYFSSSISSSDKDSAYYSQTFYYTIYSTSVFGA